MNVRSGRRRAAAALLALASFAVACSSGETPPDDIGTPVAGGTLRVSVRDLSSLDPVRASGPGASFVLAQTFDSLTDVDASGAVVPAAAASWAPSSDGKTWTFTLGKGKFHNGDPVTAYDFKFAFDRITSKTLDSEAAFQLEPIQGFKAARIDGTATGLSGVQVVNPSTLRIVLDAPFYELPVYLSHPSLGPVSQKVFNKDANAFAASPIGNGPFKVQAPKTAQGVTLVRFDDHAGSTAYLDAVDVQVDAGPDDGYRAYLRNEVDVADIPSSVIEEARGRIGPAGFTPYWAAVYFGPNLRLEKFKKPEMRKAISLAINRAAIATTVYGGTKAPATGIIPTGIPGFAGGACADCTFDPTRARSLIQSAFGGSPPEVVIDHLDASPSREVAGAIKANLEAVGLKIRLRAHKSKAYLQTLAAGTQELAELGWLAETPSPDGFLAQQLRTGSPNNQVAFADPAFDGLIKKAREASGLEQRRGLYKEAEARALSQMAIIPVVFFRNHHAVAERVQGLRLDGAGIFDAARVWLVTKP